jgi:hypothetical protein
VVREKKETENDNTLKDNPQWEYVGGKGFKNCHILHYQNILDKSLKLYSIKAPKNVVDIHKKLTNREMLSLLSQADAIAEFTAPSNMSVKSQLEPLSKEELKSLINIIRKNEQKRLNEIVNKLIDKKKKNTLDLLTI